jgi:choline dehydrogenase-like flavoprotein
MTDEQTPLNVFLVVKVSCNYVEPDVGHQGWPFSFTALLPFVLQFIDSLLGQTACNSDPRPTRTAQERSSPSLEWVVGWMYTS